MRVHNDRTPATASVGATAGVRGGGPGALPRESSGRQYVAVPGVVVEDPARAANHGRERVVVHPHREPGLVHQEYVEPADQRAAAGHDDSALQDVARQLRRGHLEGTTDRVDDPRDRLLNGVPDARGVDPDGFRETGDE